MGTRVLWILRVLGVMHGLYHLGSNTRRRRFESVLLPAEAVSASHSSTAEGLPVRLRQCAIHSVAPREMHAHCFAARRSCAAGGVRSPLGLTLPALAVA